MIVGYIYWDLLPESDKKISPPKNENRNKYGYGRAIRTKQMVRLNGKWRRVLCYIFSNSGTCYIPVPRSEESEILNGPGKDWLVVH